jgi:hypothetical protein
MGDRRVAPELSIELETLALREAARSFEDINWTHFNSVLRKPRLVFSTASSRLGRWLRQPRIIELSSQLLTDHGWGTLVEVLKHEMAHQYLDEVLAEVEETSHGPVFRQVCEARGIDFRAAGVPESSAAAGDDARVLERVAKLLALAESSNLHEAEAAMGAAQRLMLKYNIDAGLRLQSRRYAFRHLGKPSGRVSEAERVLAGILDEHFFVEAIWVPVWRPLEGKRGTVLEVCGTKENLEMAEYVHSFLLHTGERLWREHRRHRNATGNFGRRSFLAGVMHGFRDKLVENSKASQKAGLVWLGDQELKDYYRRRHPRVRRTRVGGALPSASFAWGRRAGQQIVLHRGISQGPSQRQLLLSTRQNKASR